MKNYQSTTLLSPGSALRCNFWPSVVAAIAGHWCPVCWRITCCERAAEIFCNFFAATLTPSFIVGLRVGPLKSCSTSCNHPSIFLSSHLTLIIQLTKIWFHTQLKFLYFWKVMRCRSILFFSSWTRSYWLLYSSQAPFSTTSSWSWLTGWEEEGSLHALTSVCPLKQGCPWKPI